MTRGEFENRGRSGLPKCCTPSRRTRYLAPISFLMVWGALAIPLHCMKRPRLSRSHVCLLFQGQSSSEAGRRLFVGEKREKHSRKRTVGRSVACGPKHSRYGYKYISMLVAKCSSWLSKSLHETMVLRSRMLRIR
jgi:hypothetical protein